MRIDLMVVIFKNMNRQKTEVKVVVTSKDVDDVEVRSENKTGIKHSIRTVSTTSKLNDLEHKRVVKTPSSGVSVTASVRTPTHRTPRMNGGPSVTPKSTRRISEGEATSLNHATPTTAPKTYTPKCGRTPVSSATSKTPSALTPRHGPPGVPLPKRLRKGDEPQKSECGQSGGLLQRAKSVRSLDSEDKEEDVKRKDCRTGVRRVLSSSTFNVSSPARLSSDRFSLETKSPLPSTSRSSFGRPSCTPRISFGTYTPTTDTSRRSSLKHGKSSRLMVDHSHTSLNGVALTPDVARLPNTDLSLSPSAEACFGRAESTAISVGVRVRPLSNRELSASETKIVDVFGNTLKVSTEGGPSHTFAYDHCFWSCDEYHPLNASQEKVYTSIAQPLLEKAYEGYNTCLFAYGQTGSGKSYTMLGDGTLDELDSDTPSSVGVIPRFCRELFDRAKYIHSQNPSEHQLPQCLVEIEISYFEIYNERIYDLLSGSGGVSGDHREPLRVREHPENGPYVEGVACHLVSSYDDLQTWLMLGNKERSIAATGMNDKSSRSHAVFTIKLTQTMVEDVEGEQLESSKVSVINLVDLAGSERVASSQSQGDRLKEGVCINKSLLTLGKVITALAESAGRRRTFVPYRESVLTYLLKESLGGNSRTAMIATISPCKSHLEESLSTLRYAQQARKIVNHNYVNEDPTALIIRSLKEEVERLRRQHLSKSPSVLFDLEPMEDEEKLEAEEGIDEEREKVLLEKENAIRQKEIEKNQAIKEKETEIALLREQLRSQHHLREQNRNLEERLKENEARQQQVLESQRQQGISCKGDKGPQLVNLCEDPQLSETLAYSLKDGRTTLGQSNSDLILKGLHCEDTHCTIVNSKGKITLHPKIDTETYVNGKLMSSPVKLNHGDRVILAGIYYFRVNNPPPDEEHSSKIMHNMDFHASQLELLREQERRLREEADEAIKTSKAELEREMCQQRDLLLQDLYEASSELRNKEQLVNELEGKQCKLEEEKRLLEEQLQRNKNQSKSLDVSLLSPQRYPTSNILQEVEAVLNESVMEVRRDNAFYVPPKLGFMIKEANLISKRLRKPYEFTVQEILMQNGVEIAVLIKDRCHQTTAKLTVNRFIDKLHILRDIVNGEESEGEMFESSLIWERTENMNRIPGFVNKLQECVNSSFNCSFTAPAPSLSRSSNKRRRSSIIFNLEKTGSTSSCGTSGGSGGPIAVATAIHETLSKLPTPNVTSHPLQAMLDTISKLHTTTTVIKHHITDPGSALPEEDLSQQLIMLLCLSQTALQNLSSAGHMELNLSCSSCCELQEKFRKALIKTTTFISRIFQGVKNEVNSLVEEETTKLLSFVENLIMDVGKLALIASLPLPEISKLKPGGPLSLSFTEGLRAGLESLLLKTADSALHSADILSKCSSSTSCSKVITAAQSAMKNITFFLKKFAQLNAAVELEDGLSEDEQRDIISDWILRVESAADTIFNLQASLTDIGEHVEMPQALNSEVWRRLALELKQRLEKLMYFAGINSASLDDTSSSFSMSHDLNESTVFMNELKSVAKTSAQSVENLLDIIRKSNAPNFDELVSNDMQKRVFGQWPRNSDEYKMYLTNQKNEKRPCQSPKKSSLRTSTLPKEEKKVRFDIEYDSASESYIENTDTVNM